jgi:hypothetical protein
MRMYGIHEVWKIFLCCANRSLSLIDIFKNMLRHLQEAGTCAYMLYVGDKEGQGAEHLIILECIKQPNKQSSSCTCCQFKGRSSRRRGANPYPGWDSSRGEYQWPAESVRARDKSCANGCGRVYREVAWMLNSSDGEGMCTTPTHACAWSVRGCKGML